MPWVENKKSDLASLTIPPHLVDTKETRDALANYYTSVEILDVTIGRMTTILDKNGYRDHTLFIYTSDHGPNLAFAKWCLYDEGSELGILQRRWTR